MYLLGSGFYDSGTNQEQTTTCLIRANLLPWNHLESCFTFGAQIAEKSTYARVLTVLSATVLKSLIKIKETSPSPSKTLFR